MTKRIASEQIIGFIRLNLEELESPFSGIPVSTGYSSLFGLYIKFIIIVFYNCYYSVVVVTSPPSIYIFTFYA